MKFASKVDANQRSIVTALRAVGCSVISIAGVGKGCPDLLVGRNGWTWLLELKVAKEKPNPAQVAWHEAWKGGPVWVVRSPVEAIDVINAKWAKEQAP